MRHRISALLGFLLASLTLASQVVAQKVKVHTVVSLDRNEWQTDAQAFHAGGLWVGQADHSLSLYSPEGKRLLSKVQVPHSVTHIYPYWPTSVLIVGKTSKSEYYIYFSIATWENSRLSVETTRLPVDIQTERFAGSPRKMFFTENEGVFQWLSEKDTADFLKPRIVAAGDMLLVGDFLFVVERKSPFPGDEDLVRINLANERASWTFGENRKQLSNPTSLRRGESLAISEALADQVHIIDVASNTVEASIAAPGNVVGLTTLGNCLVGVSESTRQVYFWDVRPLTPVLIAQWDLQATLGESFVHPRHVVADKERGRLYIRSAYPCPTCSVSTNLEIVAEDTSGQTLKLCTDPSGGQNPRHPVKS